MKRFAWMVGVAVLALVQGCGAAPLRVAMYPYLPDAADDDFAAYKDGVEARFEAAHPGVDVEVDLLVVDEDWAVVQPGVEPYSFDQLVDVLHGDGRYDVVEIDSALLGELVETGLIAPWSDPAADGLGEGEATADDVANGAPTELDWHPAALVAATYDGQRFGYPHYLCSRFVFGRAPALDDAVTFDEVAAAVAEPGRAAPRIAMDLSGSWGTPATVLDLVYDQGDAAAGLLAFDSVDLDPLRALMAWCPVDAQGRVRCLHDTEACDEGDGVCGYDEDSLVSEFVAGQLDAFIGYSERAHLVRRAAPDAPLHVSPLILGPDGVPLVFVDVYVRRAGCEGACADAAFAFAQWMSRPEELEYLLMSRDADDGVPRYLLPANQAAYATSIGDDPLFVRFRDLTAAALPHPNAGLLAARPHVRAWVLEQLKQGASADDTDEP